MPEKHLIQQQTHEKEAKSVSFTLPRKNDSSSNISKTSSLDISYSKAPHLEYTLNGSPSDESGLKGSNLS